MLILYFTAYLIPTLFLQLKNKGDRLKREFKFGIYIEKYIE